MRVEEFRSLEVEKEITFLQYDINCNYYSIGIID